MNGRGAKRCAGNGTATERLTPKVAPPTTGPLTKGCWGNGTATERLIPRVVPPATGPLSRNARAKPGATSTTIDRANETATTRGAVFTLNLSPTASTYRKRFRVCARVRGTVKT